MKLIITLALLAKALCQTTAVTGCHFHGATQFCMDGEGEHGYMTPAPALTDAPESYTDCHAHGSETWCMDGDEEYQYVVEGEETGSEAHDHEHETGSEHDHEHETESEHDHEHETGSEAHDHDHETGSEHNHETEAPSSTSSPSSSSQLPSALSQSEENMAVSVTSSSILLGLLLTVGLL